MEKMKRLLSAFLALVLVLSLLNPHTDGADTAGKVHTYGVTKEFVATISDTEWERGDTYTYELAVDSSMFSTAE